MNIITNEKRVKFKTITPIFTLSLLLAACGGGTNGGVNSTPVPAPSPVPTPSPAPAPSPTPSPLPPTGVNSTLLGNLKSETFSSLTAKGTISVPNSDAEISTGTSTPDISIIYNEDDQSYTIASADTQQKFLPGDIDNTQTSDFVKVYKKSTATSGESLTMIAPGTGEGQTQYVGTAFYQKQVNGTTSIDGEFQASIYGVKAPQDAIPRTGAAVYDVIVFGAYSRSDSIYSFGGSGTYNIDFERGAMYGGGRYNEIDVQTRNTRPNLPWLASSSITSGANQFNGDISFNYEYTSSLNGAFYGPNADEMGAVFNGNPDPYRVLVGALFGTKGDGAINTATKLNNPESFSFVPANSTSLEIIADGNAKINSVALGDKVDFVAISPNYGEFATAYKGNMSIDRTFGVDTQINYRHLTGPFDYNYMGAAEYYYNIGDKKYYDSFIYGFETPGGSLPKTGSAYYNVEMAAGVFKPGSEAASLRGRGTLEANFATGNLSTAGDYHIYNQAPAVSSGGLQDGLFENFLLDQGTWSGSAQIGSTSSGFDGTLQLNGKDVYKGAFSGAFYGPNVEEIGATSNLTSGNSRIAAVLYGNTDQITTLAHTPLSALRGETLLGSVFSAGGNHFSPVDNVYTAVNYLTFSIDKLLYTHNENYGKIYFSDISHSYEIDNRGMEPLVTADAKIYEGTYLPNGANEPNKYKISEYITDGQGGNIDLTYTSLAKFEYMEDINTLQKYYIAFGNQTPSDFMPRTGTASYSSAKIYGSAQSGNPENIIDYDLTGNAKLNVDFASSDVSATLMLSTMGTNDQASINLGTHNFIGNIAQSMGAVFNTTASDTGANGFFNGLFFGPNADEFGGAFNFNTDINNQHWHLYGSTVGKKD